MSIIHDALKKVQQSMQNNKSASPESGSTPEEPIETLPSSNSSSESPKEKGGVKAILLVIGALIVVILSGAYLSSQLKAKYPSLFSGLHWHFSFNFFKKQSPPKPLAQIVIPAAPTHHVAPPSESPKPQNVSSTPIKPQVPSVPSNSTPSPTVLNVQGIMANNNHNVALINNNVYEEGDVVNGYKILKINLNAITVEHDGQEEIIPIKR